MTPQIRERLCECLWGDHSPLGEEESHAGDRVFAVLDGAQDTRIFGALDGASEDKCCLYSVSRTGWPGHDLKWSLIGVSPYLVELERISRLTNLVLKEGWDRHWGIFCRSDSTIERLRRHFRHFLMAQTENGRKLVFRFYDPRVLRAYLPTCLASELNAFFGPVSAFVVAGEEPETVIEYRFAHNRLVTRRFRLSELGEAPKISRSAEG